jgi:hypothetical protein
MLQIITGRFFKTDALYRTVQRTVLYSNFRVVAPIETDVGSYAPAGSSYDVVAGVYTVEQRLESEGPDGSMRVLVAVGPEVLAQDFAALVSFCLNVTCSLDSALVSRLTQLRSAPFGVNVLPGSLVRHVFDKEVILTQPAVDALPRFIARLVTLERVRFSAVMRAIRRYIIGLHRIADDLALAYALLVASIESLAQGFDQFKATWEDLDPSKKSRIDRALHGADLGTKESVRAAVLEIEHVALARRFREFALAHIPPSFYREEAAGRPGSARASDLDYALNRAYAFRSRLVHRLEELPPLLVHAPREHDIILIDNKPALTFEGLARVARRVIMSFA